MLLLNIRHQRHVSGILDRLLELRDIFVNYVDNCGILFIWL